MSGSDSEGASRRIAYLTGQYPAQSHTFVLREVQALRRLGFEVLACSIRKTGIEHLKGEEEAQEAAQTFNVIASAKNPLTLLASIGKSLTDPRRFLFALGLAWRTRPPGLRAWIWQIFYLVEAMVLARHLRAHQISHLHNHFANSSCSVAMLTSELSGIPFSFTLHGPSIFYEPRLWRIDEKIARAKFVSCISHFCRSQGMVFSDPRHWEKMRIVHCGVAPERYTRAQSTGKSLVFVGRLAAVKGVLVLLEAFARARTAHPNAHLTIVGDGPERERIKARAKALNLEGSVTFAGYLTQTEVSNTLSTSDIFMLPSFAEGVPVVLMEAMASGLPVITSRIMGVPELVDEGKTGLLVPPGDVDALANAIHTLLQDQELRTSMGQAGRMKVEAEFDQAKEAAWLEKILQGRAADGALRPEDQV